MGNLSHYTGSGSGGHGTGSNTPGSPGDVPDHVAGDGYASEDFVAGSSSSRERKKGISFDSWAKSYIKFQYFVIVFILHQSL